MGGRVLSAGELQTPDWNWEQQESIMLGLDGPATEEVQSMEEQGTWMKISLCHDKRMNKKQPLRCTSSTGSIENLAPHSEVDNWLP